MFLENPQVDEIVIENKYRKMEMIKILGYGLS